VRERAREGWSGLNSRERIFADVVAGGEAKDTLHLTCGDSFLDSHDVGVHMAVIECQF